VVAGYDEEFAFRQPDVNLGADLAAATGGRVEPVAAEVYDPAPARGAAETPLWPLLVAVALALFLLDVATRRLVVAKGDLEAWRETLTRRRRPVEALATPPARAPAPAPGQPLPDEPPPREVHPEEETFGELLKRKRRR
jgi:hypothetical protein